MSPINKSYVSIQLPLGGHSFSSTELDNISAEGDTPIFAVVDSAKTIMVPRELLDTKHPESHLHAAGIIMDGDETAVCSDDDTMVAVMAVNRYCRDMLTTKFGRRLSFTTPLLTTPLPEQGTVLHLGEKTLYVRVVKDGLRVIEAVSVENDADILYILEKINGVYDIYNMYARAEGDTKRLMRVCKKQFSNIEAV